MQNPKKAFHGVLVLCLAACSTTRPDNRVIAAVRGVSPNPSTCVVVEPAALRQLEADVIRDNKPESLKQVMLIKALQDPEHSNFRPAAADFFVLDLPPEMQRVASELAACKGAALVEGGGTHQALRHLLVAAYAGRVAVAALELPAAPDLRQAVSRGVLAADPPEPDSLLGWSLVANARGNRSSNYVIGLVRRTLAAAKAQGVPADIAERHLRVALQAAGRSELLARWTTDPTLQVPASTPLSPFTQEKWVLVVKDQEAAVDRKAFIDLLPADHPTRKLFTSKLERQQEFWLTLAALYADRFANNTTTNAGN